MPRQDFINEPLPLSQAVLQSGSVVMRGVGLGVSPLAGVRAAIGLLLLSASAAVAADATAQKTDDYYTRRARTIIEAEKNEALKPHPLAAAYPGMDVVVCAAGCPGREGPQVVDIRPEPAAAETAREGSMVPTSASAQQPPAASEDDAACLAGCYDSTAAVAPLPEPARPWATSVKADPPPRDPLSPIR